MTAPDLTRSCPPTDVPVAALPCETDDDLWSDLIDDVNADAPRRFWLCQTNDPDADPVLAWGLAFADRVVALVTGPGIHVWTSESAERLCARLARYQPVRLVWCDEVAQDPPAQ